MRAEIIESVLDVRQKRKAIAIPCAWAMKAVPHLTMSDSTAVKAAVIEAKRSNVEDLNFATSFASAVTYAAVGMKDDIDVSETGFLIYEVTTEDVTGRPIIIHTLLTDEGSSTPPS